MDQEADLENWARINGYWYDSPQDYYRSLGYKFYGYGRDAQREFVILLKQRFFRQEHIMDETEITLFMRYLGFQKILKEPYHTVRYYSNTVIAEDLHPGNIWMTANNNVVIIDAYYRFNSPGLGLGGKFTFGE